MLSKKCEYKFPHDKWKEREKKVKKLRKIFKNWGVNQEKLTDDQILEVANEYSKRFKSFGYAGYTLKEIYQGFIKLSKLSLGTGPK